MGWRKSSFCHADGCVEIDDSIEGEVLVRDGKLGDDSPVLVFDDQEWAAFRAGMIAGEY